MLGPLFPLIARIIPNQSTTSVKLGRAMINIAMNGAPRPILHTPDLNRLAG